MNSLKDITPRNTARPSGQGEFRGPSSKVAPQQDSRCTNFLIQAVAPFLLIIAITITALAACTPHEPPLPEPQLVTIATDDGAQLHALYQAPPRKPTRGIILIPEKGAPRANWQHMGQRAALKGYAALALDLRGHGDSTVAPGQPATYDAFTPQDWRACANDVAAAVAWLARQDVPIEQTAVAGEGLGGAIGLYYAARQPALGAVIMVSPILDQEGINAREELTRLQDCPVLLLAADGDAYAASACTTLKKAAPALCEIRHYMGTAHGALLFENSETAAEELFLWLEQMISPPRG